MLGLLRSQVWDSQIDTLKMKDGDFLISNVNGTQELWNVVANRSIKNLLYAGVPDENMCIMGRPFAIEAMAMLQLGWARERVAVVRELVDVMYTPKDAPYVSHADGLSIHTAYVEKFWAVSVSMCTTSSGRRTSSGRAAAAPRRVRDAHHGDAGVRPTGRACDAKGVLSENGRKSPIRFPSGDHLGFARVPWRVSQI